MTTDLLARPVHPIPPHIRLWTPSDLEIVDDATRREFIALLGAAGLLAACGDNGDGGGDAAADTDTRSIDHALGTTAVPADPQAVVALGIAFEALLVLGITPAAIGDRSARVAETYGELLPDVDLDAIPTIGDAYEPNIEAVAAQRPDLIVGDEFIGDFYEDLSAIAPTVLVGYLSNGGWRERFPAIADAVGRADRVEAIDAEYQAVIDGLPESLGDEVVAFVRDAGPEAFRIDSLPAAFPGSVAEDAGIPTLQPEGVGEFNQDSGFLEASAENLGALDGATLIVLADNSFYDPEVADSLSVLEQNPLWATLPAVQAGRVIQIPGPIYNGGNYYAATLLLQALSAVAS